MQTTLSPSFLGRTESKKIHVFGIQSGNEKTADEILQKEDDPKILDTRYILCNVNSDIVAVIKHPPEDHYLAEVDCRYKSLREWNEILTAPDTSILPKKISHIECIGDKNYLNRFESLLECEIDTIYSQLRGLPGRDTMRPMKINAKKKLFAYLSDYEI